MRNRLNFSLVQKKCCFNQCLAITGRTCISNSGIFRKFWINLLNWADCCFQWASVIITVERIQKTSILAYQSCLSRSGTCIDTEITVPLIRSKITCSNFIRWLAFIKLLIVLFCCKQRIHTLYFEIHFNGMTESVFQFCQRNSNIFLCIQCRTDCCEQMRILRYNRMFIIQLQCTDECFL